MSGKKDAIIGFASGYRPEQIALWVLSINASGFDGRKILGSYDLPKDTKEFAESNGFEIIELGKVRRSRYSDRFLDLHNVLSEQDIYRVVTTDVADVVFIENPFHRLDSLLIDCSVISSPEYIRYIDEDWNFSNMLSSFGVKMLRLTANRTVCNCGVIAGYSNDVKDISLNVHKLCMHTQYDPADQSAYNIIIGMMGDEIKYARPNDAWAANLAVHYHPEWVQKLSTKYHVQDDGRVLNENGLSYSIVHQYNRSKELTKSLQERFL